MRLGLVLVAVLLCGCGKKADPIKGPALTTWPEARLVAMGSDHACAVASDGEVRCFGGTNIYEQGGAGVQLAFDRGVTAKGLDDHPVRLVAGAHSTCALYADGKIMCLGTMRRVPGRKGTEDPNDPYVELAVNSRDLCAVRKSGKVLCWTTDLDFEVVEGLPPATSISLGYERACALTRDHDAYCFRWPRGPKIELQKVASNVAAVVTSGFATCVVGADRKLACKGETDRGVLGTLDKSDALIPIADDVEGLTLTDHACFLRAGAPYCWGWNAFGQVGDGTRENITTPTKVETTDSFVSVVASGMRTCGRTTKGALVCWGLRRSDDILGDKSVARFSPAPIANL